MTHRRKTDLFSTVIASKLFECMGMGIPVLHGVAGESADIVRRAATSGDRTIVRDFGGKTGLRGMLRIVHVGKSVPGDGLCCDDSFRRRVESRPAAPACNL